MALFAISDLHLSFGTDKPMDVFGHRWEDYENRLKMNWENIVSENDTVIMNGDNSWATYLEDTKSDFDFINNLPGKKILLKGNHDYWWSTINKQRKFCEEMGFSTINFLQNQCIMCDDIAICGTRGWQLTSGDEHDIKVYQREIERLKLSLNDALKYSPNHIVCALHYPPDESYKKVMEEFGVSVCLYGHLHGNSHKLISDTVENGIIYRLVSCDYLNFVPKMITFIT